MTSKHISKLGLKARDKVTGFKGVITSVSFDLYGCVQALVTPAESEDKIKESFWLDIPRLEILSDEPVLNPPDFEAGYGEEKNATYIASGKKGAAFKPAK